MEKYISPNEEGLFGSTDSETIQNAICMAENDGCRTVLIPRYNMRTGKNEWRISESIKLPSNFTVFLDNCYMVQETGTYDNMFTNLYSWEPEKHKKLENEQTNISIIGLGNVILDGGVHNHLVEKTSGKFNQPPLRRNNMFLWINVSGLRIENLHIRNQRWWAINHMFCRNVTIKDIDFYAIPHVNNMDGIDMRMGCNNFDIQNITGRTGDDVIAMTALHTKGEMASAVEGKDLDIHDIKIKNVKADPYYCFLVRILNHDGSNIYNIDIDTVMDVSDYTKKMPSATCVGIGSNMYSFERPAIHGETRYINVKNITSRSRFAVLVSKTLCHAEFSNIKTYGDNIEGFAVSDGCTLEDVRVKHLWYGAKQQDIYMSKELKPDQYRGTVLSLPSAKGDISFLNVNADLVKTFVKIGGEVNVTIDGYSLNNAVNTFEVSPESKLFLNGEIK